MSKRIDLFLTITGLCVVAGFVYLLASLDEYEQARDDHRGMFVTNEHVTNLHHELVEGE